jgi:deoxyribonuclease V
MILAVDVDYRDGCAYVGGVTFENWSDNKEKDTFISFLDNVSDYQPGQFYRRELPCILRLIEEHKLKPEYIVIDGFVFLNGENKPGLGKYLYDALNSEAAIVGVAKNPFKETSVACEVYRGLSKNPLYVTSIGVALDDAKTFISTMHGKHRVPELLKRVDHVCRKGVSTL